MANSESKKGQAGPGARKSSRSGSRASTTTPERQYQEADGRPALPPPDAPTQTTATPAMLSVNEAASAGGAPAPTNNGARPELAEKIRELVRLAQEQGHLTYSDI